VLLLLLGLRQVGRGFAQPGDGTRRGAALGIRCRLVDDLKWETDHGYIKGTVNADALVDRSYVDAALKTLGPYR
jgi:hypothetical protein